MASHLTAAALRGTWPSRGSVHLTVPPIVGLRPRAGVVLHRNALAAERVTKDRGVRLTDPLRTVVDCARVLPADDAIAIGDAALWARQFTPTDLRAELLMLPRVRGVVRVESALRRCRLGAQSPQETRLRLRCVDGGLPEPALQIPILTRHGLLYGDLGWAEHRVCAEYDGLEPHSAAGQFAGTVSAGGGWRRPVGGYSLSPQPICAARHCSSPRSAPRSTRLVRSPGAAARRRRNPVPGPGQGLLRQGRRRSSWT